VGVRHAYVRVRAGDRAGPQCLGSYVAARVDDDDNLGGPHYCWFRRLDGAGRCRALSVTFRRLHGLSGVGGNLSHLLRVSPAAATQSRTGGRTETRHD
jgi:hypothetical protein